MSKSLLAAGVKALAGLHCCLMSRAGVCISICWSPVALPSADLIPRKPQSFLQGTARLKVITIHFLARLLGVDLL